MFRGLRYEYRNIDTGNSSGGSTGGDLGPVGCPRGPLGELGTDGATSPTNANAGTLNTAQGTVDQNSEPSILSTAKGSTGETTIATQVTFPDKYTVKNADGTVNTEASTQKLIEGYGHLAKKMGESGSVVPDSADGYKIEFDSKALGLPDSIKPETLTNDPEFKGFIARAHQAGFTNEQINLVAGEYLQMVQSIFDRKENDDALATRETLLKTWGDQAKFDANINNAKRAFNHFATEEDKALINEIGNNPIVLRILANVGASMREDASARSAMPSNSRESIREMMMSEAYQDAKHPDHARVERTVREFYQQTYGDAEYF